MTAPVVAGPQQDGRIVVDQLTKVFNGKLRAVDQLSFTVEPGSVTGFLGPNGAGKTTTLRMLLGLVHPTAGRATIGGELYRDIPHPLTRVGAALESSSYHPARTARNHLRIMCVAAGLPVQRADATLDLVGLRDAAKRKVRGFSLGMRQRLALAAALLGDPRVLVLDEPANGLDPDGIRWLRGFFRHMAGEGRTVLVSSHQLNEVQEVADRVVILNRGQLVRSGSIRELLAGSDSVLVRGPQLDPLVHALRQHGAQSTTTAPGTVQVHGMKIEHIGHLAYTSGVELYELSKQGFDLEDLFFHLTAAQYAGAKMGDAQSTGAAGQWGPGGMAAMIRLVRAEFLKLRSTQVWFWMLLAAVGVTVLLVVAQLAPSNQVTSSSDAVDALTAPGAAYVVVFVLGVLGITTEFRYQTITQTVLITPSRWVLVTAKLITYALVGAIYALICVVVEMAVALPWLAAKNIDISLTSQHVPRALLGVFFAVALFGIVGLGAGALLRNQIVAVSVGVIFLLVINNLLLLIPGVKYVFPYTPVGAVDALFTVTGSRDANDITLLSGYGGAIVLVLWAFVPAVLGAALTLNRDIT